MNFKTFLEIKNETAFKQTALKVFKYQYTHNKVYKDFCNYLNKTPDQVSTLEEIPFLPIDFFKYKKVIVSKIPVQQIFTSSGTTQHLPSKHYVSDLAIYEQSFKTSFSLFYGNIKEYVVLALLPSYLERTGSSLIYMVSHLIEQSQNINSGFYLDDIDELAEKLKNLDKQGQKIILIGVSFALLDLIEKYKFSLTNTIVMETGGMKGRRKELIREELHEKLKKGFGVKHIHSEYGMTELLSQAYSKSNGIFYCPPWMSVYIREPEDPFTFLPHKKTGGINIIDLANINSCAFIATQDLGKKYPDGSFEVLGRFDQADIRGCNLMVM